MTLLRDDFRFSQSSLQDYTDCPRRFELRYLLQLSWPAIQSEPVLEGEQFMRQGAQFHRLIQQYSLGVPVNQLNRQASQIGLETWWQDYLEHGAILRGLPPLSAAPPLSQHELSLGVDLADFRLVARFDRLDLAGGRARIVDWKTTRQRPSRTWLAQRVQTRLYRYMLAKGGAQITGGAPVDPAAIQLVYWFAGFPEQPELFEYSTAEYTADEANLLDLLRRLQATPPGGFQLTEDRRRCALCVYRSLCDRGAAAGDAAQDEVAHTAVDHGLLPGFDLDFEQVAEIEF